MKTNTCILFIILVASQISVQAQSLTPPQTDRLFKMGQLWGHITYFHPYLQYKKLPFDSAYAAAVPKVLAAQTEADFSAAVNEWLSILKDPITRTELTSKKSKEKFISDFQKRNGIGILTLSGSLEDWNTVIEKLNFVADSLTGLKGLILDIKDLTEPISWLLEYSNLQSKLFKGSVTTPGRRSVAHTGFVPEVGSTSGGYQTYFKNFPPQTISGNLPRNVLVVFIVSNNSGVPKVAYAMQKVGKAAIIAKEQITDQQNAISYPLTDKITANLRTEEIVTTSTKVDWMSDKADKKELMQKAIEIIDKNELTIKTNKGEPTPAMLEKKPNYPPGTYPTLGYRALAAAKIYSVINYFFPNKKLMTVNWDSVVKASIAPIVLAKDSASYHLAVNALYANIQDGHGFIRGSMINKLILGGSDPAPIAVDMVEGKFVVTGILHDSLAKAVGVQKGDVLLKRNGKDISEWMNTLKKYMAYSNEVAGTSYAASDITKGADNTEAVFTIQKKNGKTIDVKLPFYKKLAKDYWLNALGRAKEPVLRFLTPEIGYADLDRLKSAAVDSMFDMFKNTKAIVFDMRGYPHGTGGIIAPRLTQQKQVAAVKFTDLELSLPKIVTETVNFGAIETWTSSILNITDPSPDKWQYTGKTVMLMNEHTQSQAEGTGMLLRAANGTRFIGSQTAGANGDVTNFTIPGGMNLYFSGATVWYPDGKQLQRIGLEPDVLIRPTIRGIQAGKDEVLVRAVKYLQKGK